MRSKLASPIFALPALLVGCDGDAALGVGVIGGFVVFLALLKRGNKSDRSGSGGAYGQDRGHDSGMAGGDFDASGGSAPDSGSGGHGGHHGGYDGGGHGGGGYDGGGYDGGGGGGGG